MKRSMIGKLNTGEKVEFTAIVEKYSLEKGVDGNRERKHTICLRDVKDSKGRIVTDHIWTNEAASFMKRGIKKGDVVRFLAEKKTYTHKYDRYGSYGLKRFADIGLAERNGQVFNYIQSEIICLAAELCTPGMAS